MEARTAGGEGEIRSRRSRLEALRGDEPGPLEFFFAPDGPEEGSTVVLFHHIHNTAGTSLRALIRFNMLGSKYLTTAVPPKDPRSAAPRPRVYRQLYKDFTPHQRASLRCVMGHGANRFLSRIDRPIQAFTLVRDPVDRVVSLYYAAASNRGKLLEQSDKQLGLSHAGKTKSTLVDIFTNLGTPGPAPSKLARNYAGFFNGQSRSLLDPHYNTRELPYSAGPPPDADVWRERLFELVSARYLVGLQERYADFVAELEQRLGWTGFVEHRNPGGHRPSLDDLPPEAVETIRAYNWLDDELHRHCEQQADKVSRVPPPARPVQVAVSRVGELPGADNENAGGGLEVFFSLDDGADERPALLVHHIQKTAGSALRAVVRANLRSRPYVRSVGRLNRLGSATSSEFAEYHGAYYASLTPGQRASLCCAMGHTANYLLPLIERPVVAITLVRDPVDRVISRYFMDESRRGMGFEVTGRTLTRKGGGRDVPNTLGDIYAQLGSAFPKDSALAFGNRAFFNGQSRSLLEPHYDALDLCYSAGPSPDADLWRERLFTLISERYLVGLQEDLDEFLGELEHRFGWQHFEARGKIGHHRPLLDDVAPESSEMIREYNWLDDDLYRFCSTLIEERRAKRAS
jgi:hypothetical protein